MCRKSEFLRPSKACNLITPSNIYGSYTVHIRFSPYIRCIWPYIYGLLKPIYGHTVMEPVAQCHIRYRIYGVPRIRRIYGHTVWANPTHTQLHKAHYKPLELWCGGGGEACSAQMHLTLLCELCIAVRISSMLLRWHHLQQSSAGAFKRAVF